MTVKIPDNMVWNTKPPKAGTDFCTQCQCDSWDCECRIDAFIESITEEVTEYVEDRLTGTLYEIKTKVLKEDFR
jgi:hypothetical protein